MVADVVRDVADASVDGPAMASGIAPRNAVPGESMARDGSNAVSVASGGEQVFRVDVAAGEHVQFMLRFGPERAAVVLRVDRWNGTAPVTIGETDGGRGLRTLAVFDPSGPRTYWARVRPMAALTGVTLTVTRTPFQDGAACTTDCARLLQLPLPNDPRVDGYATDGATVFRYQFGRRDLLMFVRHAAHTMQRRGAAPFIPQDLSQWDGETPGTDTGAPRHASHQRGKDVDLSLYGTDGLAPWRSYCTVVTNADGRACTVGSVRGFDAATNAQMFADFFATGRVTMCFLDAQLITAVRPAARAAMFPTAVATQFTDGTHLQHWPNHDNHIHVRVSEAATTGSAFSWEPFEAP